MTNTRDRRLPHALHVLISDYGWIHIGLGLIGNIAFVVGSVLFFWDSMKHCALWLFVIGSSGMLIGSIGSALSSMSASRATIKNRIGSMRQPRSLR